MSFTAFTPHLLKAMMDWMAENRLAGRINIMVHAKQLTARSITTGQELDMVTAGQKPHRQARDEAVTINLGGNACPSMQYVGDWLQLNLAVSGWKALVSVPVDDILAIQIYNGEALLGIFDLGDANAALRRLDGSGPKDNQESSSLKDEKERPTLRLVK